MEIIKSGELPAHCCYTASCDFCGCEVSFTKNEASYDRNLQYYSVQCPTVGCGKEISAPSKDPEPVWAD